MSGPSATSASASGSRSTEALERVDEPGLRELLRRVFGIPQVNGFRLRGR